MSVAVALPRSIALSVSDVASALISFGGVSFGGVVSTTSTIWDVCGVGQEGRFGVQVNTLFTIGNAVVALFVIDTTPTVSVAFAFPISTTLSLALVASIVISFGGVSFGAVVSFTVTV